MDSCTHSLISSDDFTLVTQPFKDAPQKRVDSPCRNRKRNSQLYESSSGLTSILRRPRAGTTYQGENGKLKNNTRRPNSANISPPSSPTVGRRRLNTFTKAIFSRNNNGEQLSPVDRPRLDSDSGLKKSWFPGSLFHVENPGPQVHEIIVENHSLAKVKADFLHTILIMPKVTHNPLSNTKFKLEYKRNKGRTWLRAAAEPALTIMEAEISEIKGSEKKDLVDYKVILRFIAGSSRKYRKLCQKIQTALINRGKFRSMQNSPNLDVDRSISDYMRNNELGGGGGGNGGVELVSPQVILQINESIKHLKLKNDLKASIL